MQVQTILHLILNFPWPIAVVVLSACAIVLTCALIGQGRRRAVKLEALVKERTQELEAAAEGISSFLAIMSYKIRAPMNVVLGMAEILLAENLNKSQRAYAEDIKVSAEALIALINDILDLSKIQAGELLITPVHYRFAAMIDNVNSLISLLAGKKQINYEYIAEPGVPAFLYGDDFRLRQVLLNVLGNAVKFTFTGGVTLTVKPESDGLVFVVKDTGIGIKQENLQKMFEAFTQDEAQQMRGTSGTGLGLSISQNLIKMMGGTVTLDSEFGKGTTFTIIVPMVAGDEAKISKEEAVKLVHAPQANVLVVDDNAINLSVACGFLNLCSINPDTALSGAKAIALLEEKQYDLVFMDHMMPDMDGVEAVKIIRQMGWGIPIIALTANAVVGMREIFLEAGMNDMLVKPIEKAKMFKMLADWLPPDKVSYETPAPDTAPSRTDDKASDAFWEAIYQIEWLDADVGLEHFFGKRESYEKSLQLMIAEIERCLENFTLCLDIGDMQQFKIQAHSVKSSLAYIGALGFSEQARQLEEAGKNNDREACEAGLAPFSTHLQDLRAQLEAAFALKGK